MKQLYLLLIVVCGFVEVLSRRRTTHRPMSDLVPSLRRCKISYDTMYETSTWPCTDKRFQTYPKVEVDALLASKTLDPEIKFRAANKNCGMFADPKELFGNNTHYIWKSVCKMIRRQVNVLWSHVEGYQPTAEQASWNNGLLPVHVIEGQSLYDVACVHPWSQLDLPPSLTPYLRQRAIDEDWTGAKQHYCKIGYIYNPNYVCRPSGHINRDILVYSPHANRVFIKHVTRVPTGCSCTKCSCNRRRG